MGYVDFLRTRVTSNDSGEVLRSSPDVLLGVGPGAVHALNLLGIETVYDLARSATFAAAAAVVRAATDPASVEAREGQLPADLFAHPESVPLASALELPVNSLRLVANGDPDGLVSESLDVQTVRDLALWPPYLAAQSILNDGANAGPVGVDEVPNDLLPMSGRYPTERAYYSSFVLADVGDPGTDSRTPLDQAGPLDPIAAVTGQGFTQPALGARLTFAQSWYSQGLALGQLLHSLALAPGESTRVAMIDWSRQQTGTQTENTGQVEQIAGDTTHKRALSEVQDAVAREAQNGFSNTSSRAQQVQAGGGGGISLGPLTGGASVGYGNSSTSADTITGTSGVRSIAATMNQNVADATSQAASSARTMFASVVRELSQSEHEAVSTRVVANYNHMHALTIQYYEVVQIFRMVAQLHTFEPCLFIPMKPIDFLARDADGKLTSGLTVLRRYRSTLQAVALDADTATALAPDADREVQIEVRPTVQRDLNAHPAGPPPEPGPSQPSAPNAADTPATGSPSTSGTSNVAVVSRMYVPDGATLISVRADFVCRGNGGLMLKAGGPEGTTYQPLFNSLPGSEVPFQSTLPVPVLLQDVTALTLDVGEQRLGFVTLTLAQQDGPFEVSVPVVAYGSSSSEQVLTFRRVDPAESVLTRLAEDPLHYSQAIWRAMDSATIALLLAPYSYAGQPLATVVDPSPIGTSGNFLIFRMPAEGRDLLNGAPGAPLRDNSQWMDWVARHADYDSKVEDFVPLPSGGVFAEAVLGRANSAEKLDITRFWNWQDSPIPLTAPDIMPVATGSRATDDNTTPTGLAAPVVAFNNPTPLPDPTGLAATLGTLANGNLFRDSSGLDVTAAVAQAALSGAGTGATAAGDQAKAYAALATQKEIEMAKLATSLATGGLGGGGVSKNVTEQGAKINEGRSLDARVAAGDATNGAIEHETRAAEGETGKAVDILGKLTEPAPTPPASSDGQGGGGPASGDGQQGGGKTPEDPPESEPSGPPPTESKTAESRPSRRSTSQTTPKKQSPPPSMK
jgi:hypothetical protein